jgi:hypothetical protein
VIDAKLEERLVLSSTPATPPPAPPPAFSTVLNGNARPWRTVAQLRARYAHEARLAALLLRNEMAAQIDQYFASGSVLTPQRAANLNASLHGAVDATALGLSSMASLLPRSSRVLVPAIQRVLLGTGSSSLSSRLNAIFTATNTSSATGLQSAIAQAINLLPSQLTSQINRFFNTTNAGALAVNSSGQRIPLSQFMAQQLVSQISNTLGTLAQSFPNVLNSMVAANSATGNPNQQLFQQFGTQVSNALSTAAFEIGSALSIFNNSSNVISQIQPALSGSHSSITNLVASLPNMPMGSSTLSSAIGNAFNTGFSNLMTPVTSFLGMPAQTVQTLLPTVTTQVFTNPFAAPFTSSGFNNGFAGGPNTGFAGFGIAPSSFNTNFGTGFGNFVTVGSQGLGVITTPLGTINLTGGFLTS